MGARKVARSGPRWFPGRASFLGTLAFLLSVRPAGLGPGFAGVWNSAPATSTAPSRQLLVRRAEGRPQRRRISIRKPDTNPGTKSVFEEPSTYRGTTGRGKKSHFHLLDRYIRRIDALVPEDMEHLVTPLKPHGTDSLQATTRSLKITLDPYVDPLNITEGDVKALFAPIPIDACVLGWQDYRSHNQEVYVHFESNADCVEARKKDGENLGGMPAQIRYTHDFKFTRVAELKGVWEPIDYKNPQEARHAPGQMSMQLAEVYKDEDA